MQLLVGQVKLLTEGAGLQHVLKFISGIYSLKFRLLRRDDSHLQLRWLEVDGKNSGEARNGRLKRKDVEVLEKKIISKSFIFKRDVALNNKTHNAVFLLPYSYGMQIKNKIWYILFLKLLN